MQLNLFLLPVTIVLSLVIFVIDISLPLGVAGGVPYILVLLLALRVQGLRVTLVFGTICTLLVLLGWFFSPEGITSWIVTTNRLLAVFAIWSVVAVGLWAKRSQLMESELERIIENSPVSMVVVDSSQNILQVNSETESKFGYRREELKGEPVIILIPERFRERHEAAQEGYMKSPDIRAMGGERELFALRKDGDEFPIEIGLNPIFQDGEVVIVASIIDISERLKAMAHQKNLASILHSMGDAVISEDLNGKITAWNRAATEMFGYSEGEAIAKPTSLTLPVDRREEPFSNLEKILEGEQVLDAEILMARKDGSYFDASITMSLLVDESDRVKGATTTIRDISQRKRLERELHRAQKELLKSHESLEKQVEQRTEELERFVYTVSHDLKSPLVTISGYLGMVEKDAISGNHERMKLDMKRIAAAANHMKTLLEEILELSQIGRTHAEFEEIQMTEMVEQIKQALAGIIAEQEVQISIDARLPTVMGDRLRISEVFQNLIENAIKYSREGVGPRVEIGARLEQVGTVFFVKDNGIGIAKRHFEKVFGLFDRVDITKEGTGIGLAIVSRIIELHGGKIWVESEGEGKGSTFCFTLPVVSTR